MVQLPVTPLQLEPSLQAHPKSSSVNAIIPTYSSRIQHPPTLVMLAPLSLILPRVPNYTLATMRMQMPRLFRWITGITTIPLPTCDSFLPLPSPLNALDMPHSLCPTPLVWATKYGLVSLLNPTLSVSLPRLWLNCNKNKTQRRAMALPFLLLFLLDSVEPHWGSLAPLPFPSKTPTSPCNWCKNQTRSLKWSENEIELHTRESLRAYSQGAFASLLLWDAFLLRYKFLLPDTSNVIPIFATMPYSSLCHLANPLTMHSWLRASHPLPWACGGRR